ncbi:MAG TPA: hypothetical protein VGX16_07200 [Solirubrobacteraceae bacterium]|jgi:hypothetical protein|nr:hypothetical protein [Solirubrobacteraceae bacterium]
MRETAPAFAPAPERVDPWRRSALLEGVDREPGGARTWGDPHPWG